MAATWIITASGVLVRYADIVEIYSHDFSDKNNPDSKCVLRNGFEHDFCNAVDVIEIDGRDYVTTVDDYVLLHKIALEKIELSHKIVFDLNEETLEGDVYKEFYLRKKYESANQHENRR